MKTRWALLPSAAAVATTALLVGASAWACTASAEVSAMPSSGAAGSQTTVTGYRFDTSTPVEVRWDTRSGPVLATVNGPNFSVAVTIPASAQVGDYVIVAKNIDGDFAPATPFRVTTGAATAAQPSGSRTGTVSGGGGSAPMPSSSSDSPSTASDSSSSTSGTAAPAETSGQPTPSDSATTATPSSSAGEAAPAAATAASSPATPRAVARSAAAGPGGAVSSATAVPVEERADDGGAPAPAPSPRTASDDAWSAFASDGGLPPHGPSLVDEPRSGHGVSGLGGVAAVLVPAALASIALLSAGLVRRRRVAAPHS